MSSINKLKIYSASSLISEDIQIGPTLSIGCSGWNCPDTPDKGGGWTEIFYPDKETTRLPHYS